MRDEMRAYLNTPVERHGTHSVKWDHLDRVFGRADLMAMWVADMDFRTVPQIREALVQRASHAIYGYTDFGEEERDAEIGWLKRRHNIDVSPDWILYSPGVVDSLFLCVSCLTGSDDAVLVQPPVYGPFYRAVEANGRILVSSPLIRENDGWRMNFQDLEEKFSRGVKMMLLCSPHNPVGRVWRFEELQRLVDLAERYNVIIVSDEIHSDFTFDGHRHTGILALKNSRHCVMLTSATKSFNLAGLRHSSVIVPDPVIREKLQSSMELSHSFTPNLFGSVAQITAYRYGDEWMDAVVEYIRENRDFVLDYFHEHIPEVGCLPQEGTYLMWLDFSETGLPHESIKELLVQRGRVALNDGLFFGEEGRGWFRLNLATQRANVVKSMDGICHAIHSR